jgi:hypothetical protein
MQNTCDICFETKDSVISCLENHYFCTECISTQAKINGVDKAYMCVHQKCNNELKFTTSNFDLLSSLNHQLRLDLKTSKDTILDLEKNIAIKTKEGNNLDELLNITRIQIRISQENSLNSTCSKCGTVYNDFTGCLAVKCNNCLCYLCALCNENFINDHEAHQHIYTHDKYKNSLNGFFDTFDDDRTDGPGISYQKSKIERYKNQMHKNIDKISKMLNCVCDDISQIINEPSNIIKKEFIKNLTLENTLDKMVDDVLLNKYETDLELKDKMIEDLKELNRDILNEFSRINIQNVEYHQVNQTLRKTLRQTETEYFSMKTKIKKLEKIIEDYSRIDTSKKSAEINESNTLPRKKKFCNNGIICIHHQKYLHGKSTNQPVNPCWYIHTGDPEAYDQTNPNDVKN